MITETTFVLQEHGTLREVERTFGIPPDTTRQMVARRLVRAVKVSHRLLIDLSSLRAYLAALPVATIEAEPSRHRAPRRKAVRTQATADATAP